MKKDLGHAHFIDGPSEGMATLWHQHKFTGFPCSYRFVWPGDERPTTGWLRCPTCGDLGRIVKGAWDGDDGMIPTTLRDGELMLVIPV